MSGYEKAYWLLSNFPLTTGCVIGIVASIVILTVTFGPPYPLTLLIDLLIVAGALTIEIRMKRKREQEEFSRLRAELDEKLHPGRKNQG